MTDWANMEAGPELDALVAVMMGWVRPKTYIAHTAAKEGTTETGQYVVQTQWSKAGLCRPCPPPYSTDPAADYEVLCHVRETWGNAGALDPRFERFCECLKTLWWARSPVTTHFLLATLYLPGDYSRARLMAQENDNETA